MEPFEEADIEQLLRVYRRYLRELELKIAKFGELATPTHIILEKDEYQRKIEALEQKLQTIKPRHNLLPRHNLPPRDYEQFVGRQTELQQIQKLLLKSRVYIVVIDGVGGVGKSALALESAYIFCDHYDTLPNNERFEVIIWLSAKQSYLTSNGIHQQTPTLRTIRDLCVVIARVFNEPAVNEASSEIQLTQIEHILKTQRTLLILDNLETTNDHELLSFLHVLPDPTKAIVTSRHRIDVAYPIRLTGMPYPDAKKLIIQECNRKGVNLITEEQEDIWKRTGGVPLAMVWAIGLMGMGRSTGGVLRYLSQGQNDIARFCFEESVARIRRKPAYRLLLALALFNSSVNSTMLGEVAGLSNDEFRRDEGMSELLQLSLVNKEDELFTLLPLTYNYVTEELVKQPKLEQRLRKQWIACLLNLARPYSDLPWRRPKRRQLQQHGKHLVTLSIWSQQSERLDILLQILPALALYYDIVGQWSERLKDGLIGLDYALLVGNSQAVMLIKKYVLVPILSQQGQHMKAEQHILEALDIAKQRGTILWQCEILRSYSQILRRKGSLDQAFKRCKQALQLTTKIKEPLAKAYIEYEIGKIERDRCNWQSAQVHLVAALNVLQQNERGSSWDILCNIGFIAYQLGEYERASQIYTKCLESYKEARGRGKMVTLQVRMALLEAKLGNREVAIEYAQEALTWARRMGMVQEQVQVNEILKHLGEKPNN